MQGNNAFCKDGRHPPSVMAMLGGQVVRIKKEVEIRPAKQRRMMTLSPEREAEAQAVSAAARKLGNTPFTIRTLSGQPDLAGIPESRAIFVGRYLVREGLLIPVGRDLQADCAGLKPIVYKHVDFVSAEDTKFDQHADSDSLNGRNEAKTWPAPALAKQTPLEQIWRLMVQSVTVTATAGHHFDVRA